jgi:AcrR family transcriptional regulator
MAAVVRATVANGYESTTVADILGEAGVGRESFYELFDDKLACTLAAHKILVEDLEEHVREAYMGSGPWPERMRRALGATLDWFAADPDAARFIVVELSTVGPTFHSIFQAEYARFTKLIEDGIGDDDPSPELRGAASLAVGAMLARIYEEVVLGRAAELPRLLPDLTYELLVPFVGEEEAREEQRRVISPSSG